MNPYLSSCKSSRGCFCCLRSSWSPFSTSSLVITAAMGFLNSPLSFRPRGFLRGIAGNWKEKIILKLTRNPDPRIQGWGTGLFFSGSGSWLFFSGSGSWFFPQAAPAPGIFFRASPDPAPRGQKNPAPATDYYWLSFGFPRKVVR